MPESWWLKVSRAEKHGIDIKTEARRYAGRNPYEFIPLRRAPRRPYSKTDYAFTTRITEQPDPMLAVMLGDFVHNLRSALDHIIVASVPKKDQSNATQFPIYTVDPYARRADGEFVVEEPKIRTDFERSVRGLDQRAVAVIKENQPHAQGAEAHRWIIGLISRLENADKHRTLIAVGGGVTIRSADISFRGVTTSIDPRLPPNSFAKDGTVLGWSLPPDTVVGISDFNPSEVDVKFRGTAQITIKVPRLGGGNQPTDSYPLIDTLTDCLSETRRVLLELEPFIRR